MIGTLFTSWQNGTAPGAPHDHYSPNLVQLDRHLHELFGYPLGSGFNVRRSKNDDPTPDWSSHAFGAAKDYRYKSRAQLLAEVIPHLIGTSAETHVQAIHDYAGCRIWRAGRTRRTADAYTSWWKQQTPSKVSGMGQPGALWIHVETTRPGWGDTTPIAARLGTTSPPASTPGGAFVPATVRLGAVSADVFALQVILRHVAHLPAPISGTFDAATDSAVRDYQRTHALKVDGIVGPYTWRTLTAEASK